jgi:hypothetical protein
LPFEELGLPNELNTKPSRKSTSGDESFMSKIAAGKLEAEAANLQRSTGSLALQFRQSGAARAK